MLCAWAFFHTRLFGLMIDQFPCVSPCLLSSDSGDDVDDAYVSDEDPRENDEADVGEGGVEGDEDDEEDEEDEHERRGGRKRRRKKRKTGASLLIDEEAEEDDDIDDDDDDDDKADVKGLIADGSDDEGFALRDASREAIEAQRLGREHERHKDDSHDVVKRIEERWGTSVQDDDAEDDQEGGAPLDSVGVDQQGLQPTIRDPRMFVLRCRKPGYERRAILTLLQKTFDLKARGVDIGIYSAVAPDHLKGLLYVEAISSAQVEQAIRGLDLITSYGGIKPIELDEMTDVLQVGRRLDKQEKGNWVRVQRGMYKGDLAQVYRVPDGGHDTQVMIRMIPRLRMKRDDDEEPDDVEDDDDDEVVWDDDPSTALGKGKTVKKRPPKMLFDKHQASRYHTSGDNRVFPTRDQFSGVVFDMWNQDLYRLGLLYKKVSVKTLMINDMVVPSADELELWSAAEMRIKVLAEDPDTAGLVDAVDLKEGLFLKEAALRTKRKTSIFKGDNVEVVHGEQAGLAGVVVGFDGGVVLIEERNGSLPVRASRADVVKSFKVGDHVRVIAGKDAGHSGVIVAVKGEMLHMFTDTERKEIKVTSQQVSDSKDLATEELTRERPGDRQVELFDLVHPVEDRDANGVVVGIEGDQIAVMMSNNTVSMYAASQIRQTRQDAFTEALDIRGNKLTRNIALHVVTGPLKDRSGVVVEVSGGTVFFKGSDEVRNCGILAVPSKECEARAAAARTMDKDGDCKIPSTVPKGGLSSLPGGLGGLKMIRGGMLGDVASRRDELRDKDVKVIRGPYKGHKGKVVDSNEKTVRVELIANMKVVTLGRDKVKDMSEKYENGSDGPPVGKVGSFNAFGTGSSYGTGSGSSGGGATRGRARTPMRGGGITPYGGRTPINYGARTPSAAGSSFGSFGRTPTRAFNQSGMATPAHTGFGGGLTPSRPSDGAGPRTPANSGNAFRPVTPGRTADEYGSFGSLGVPSSSGASANPYSSYGAMVPNTPGTPAAMPVTPSGGGYGIQNMEPSTPADAHMIPQTPVDHYNMPQTPQIDPPTPQTQFEPQTPTPYVEMNTPGPAVPQTPATPEPSTPMPETPAPIDEPGTPAPTAETDETGAAQGYRVLINVVVSVPDMGGRSAVVVDAAYDGAYVNVRMLDTNDIRTLNGNQFTPVQPGIADNDENWVKVLDGHLAGRVGRLLDTSHVDQVPHGTIDFGSGEVHDLEMAFVAKFQQATQPAR